MDRILTKEQVAEITGTSRTTIQRLEAAGEFPPRRQISKNRVGWLASDVEEWLRSRPVAAATGADG